MSFRTVLIVAGVAVWVGGFMALRYTASSYLARAILAGVALAAVPVGAAFLRNK